MGGGGSTYGGEERYTGYWWVNLTEREHLERPGRRWEDNIKNESRSGMGGLNWTYLVQYRERQRALAVMNIREFLNQL